MVEGIEPPPGEQWRPRFLSDGSESTGSRARDGQEFIVLRRLTADEADPDESGEVQLWRIRFPDGTEFTAWSDEIMEGWRTDNGE